VAIKEFWYRQDLDKPVQVRQMSGVLFTEDNQGDLIGVEVSKGGHPYELTGSVIGYIIKEDGVTESVNGTLSNSRAYITLPATALDVPGIVHIAIRVTNGSEKAVVCAVRGLVNRSRSEIVNTSGRTIYGIDDLLAQIAAMEQATSNANTATTNANNAASNANEKAGLANTAASKIDGMTVEASDLSAGATPTAQISEVSGHKHIAFGIPKGDKGDTGAIGPQGQKGDTGATGPKGDTGATPNLSIGTVSTVNPDQSASATITGTAENPVLNLSLPRGQTGTITNAYGSNIPYSESDSRTIKDVVDSLVIAVDRKIVIPNAGGTTTVDLTGYGLNSSYSLISWRCKDRSTQANIPMDYYLDYKILVSGKLRIENKDTESPDATVSPIFIKLANIIN
jgi:hypothetical protein